METRQSKRPSTDTILSAVSTYHGLPIRDVISKTRKRRIVQARQMVHYLAVRLQTDSLTDIARSTGLVNHATIIHSSRTVQQERDLYQDKENEVRDILKNLTDMGYDSTLPRLKRKAVYKGSNKRW